MSLSFEEEDPPMQRKSGFMVTGLFLCAVALAAPPVFAQAEGILSGTVKGLDGKPLADATLVLKQTKTGVVSSAKTDKNGHYILEGLRVGPYEFELKDAAGVSQLQSKFDIHIGQNPLDLNLKDLITPEQLAARKKSEQETQSFQSMKAAFDAGHSLMAQAQQLRTDISKAPADQRGPMKEKLNGIYQEALQDFQTAQAAATEKDPNQHLFWFNIADAYEGLGKNEEAVGAYQKAIELAQGVTGKQAPAPSQIASYYANLGNLYGKMGKVDDANKAYAAAAAADPANAGTVWLNSGIVLYKANRLNEAVVPLQKATELLPNNAQAWYLLGAALVSEMDFKQEGEKSIPVLKPGTVEAYQKCLALDPNGPWGAQAKDAIDALNAQGAGIDTKVKVKKGKG